MLLADYLLCYIRTHLKHHGNHQALVTVEDELYGSFVRRTANLPISELTIYHRAIGTPLAWPEAKKKADQVRAWGIEVCVLLGDGPSKTLAHDKHSNFWPYGTRLKSKNVMFCCGEMK